MKKTCFSFVILLSVLGTLPALGGVALYRVSLAMEAETRLLRLDSLGSEFRGDGIFEKSGKKFFVMGMGDPAKGLFEIFEYPDENAMKAKQATARWSVQATGDKMAGEWNAAQGDGKKPITLTRLPEAEASALLAKLGKPSAPPAASAPLSQLFVDYPKNQAKILDLLFPADLRNGSACAESKDTKALGALALEWEVRKDVFFVKTPFFGGEKKCALSNQVKLKALKPFIRSGGPLGKYKS